MRNFGRYLLWQFPGWVIAGLIIFVIAGAVGVPAWVAVVTLALFVAKDLVLYPAMGAVFRPAADRRLVGATGETVEVLAPTGYVLVQGERWRATVRHGRSVPPGTAIRVVSARGLTLLVEPAEESLRAAPRAEG